MAVYDYSPTHFDAVSLTTTPFGGKFCFFQAGLSSPVDGTRAFAAVEADVVGRGPQDVRGQPQASVWELYCELVDGEVATLEAFYKVFSEERGQAYLRADDGDGASWRVAARVLSVRRVPEVRELFIVTLRVADPVWEENALTTVTGSLANISGDSASQAETNSGNRKARPVYKLSVDTVKTWDLEQDFGYQVRGYVVCRAPMAWTDLPVDLSDTLGVHNFNSRILIRWDTADGGSQALADGGETDSATSITVDANTLPAKGFAIVELTGEQFYYDGNTGTVLQNCVRGIGGSTAAAIGDDYQIDESQMLKNLDDFRVYYNGREIERFIGAPFSTDGNIWVNLSMPARVRLTAVTAGTAGDPANGGSIQFEEGVAHLPETGVLWSSKGSSSTVEDGDELISYSGRDIADRKVTGIQRSIWGQGSADVWAADDYFYLVNGLFTLAWGRTVQGHGGSNGLPPPPAPTDRTPTIDLGISNNRMWKIETFYDPSLPNRTGMWLPDYQVRADDEDSGESHALVTYTGGTISWKDKLADAAAELPVRRLVLRLPQGATDWSSDGTTHPEIDVKLLGRDIKGFQTEIFDFWQRLASGQAFANNGPASPGLWYELELRAIQKAVTGTALWEESSYHPFTMNAAGEGVCWPFVLDQDTSIDSFLVFAQMNDAGGEDWTLNFQILEDDGEAGTPEAGTVLYEATDLLGGAMDEQNGVDGLNEFSAYDPFRISQRFKAGTYWVLLTMATWAAGAVVIFHMPPGVPRAGPTRYNDGTWRDPTGNEVLYQPAVRVLRRTERTKAGPIQKDMDQFLEHNNVAATSFDMNDVRIELDDTTGAPGTPWVSRVDEASAIQDPTAYHVQGVLTNTTTGKSITLDFWIDTTGELVIDTDAKVVKYVEGNWEQHLPVGISPSDLAEWLSLDPGANTIQYAEQDMQDTDVSFEYRGRKV